MEPEPTGQRKDKMPVTVNEGTQTDVNTSLNATTETQVVKLDVGVGSAILDYGEVGGQVGVLHPDRFGSVGTVAGTANLTVHASVAGSVIYVTDLLVSSNGASEVSIYDGGTANWLAGPLHLAANGGLMGNFITPLETSSGSALIAKQSGSGTISILAKGFID